MEEVKPQSVFEVFGQELSESNYALVAPRFNQLPLSAEDYLRECPSDCPQESVFPDRFGALKNPSVTPEDQIAGKSLGEPAVMRHRQHSALIET